MIVCIANENAIIDEVFMVADDAKSVLVYDVGGSHVAAAVCWAGDYRLGPVVSALHPAEQSSDAFVEVLHSLGVQASAGLGAVSGAELAMPGPFDFAAGVSHMRHKLPYLFGVDLRRKLAERFGWDPLKVRFLHDATSFLLGEIGAGAARGVARAVGITLGTGIGSAFAVDGHTVTEGPGVPPGGEIWNLPFIDGTVEDSISSRAIRGSYERRTGLLREVVDIAADAAHDDAAAESFIEFGRHLGLALRGLLPAFGPDLVVLGGGISRSGPLFLPAAKKELEGLHFDLRISALLDDAALAGAGVAWFNGVNGALVPSPDSIGDGQRSLAKTQKK
jgi:glucokinase